MAEDHRPRRLVFCFDGTWNRLSVDSPTNVVKLAQMVRPIARDGTQQIVYYDEGIGTDNRINRWTGGIFGRGMLKIIREAYRFLIFNYRPGDSIFAFGFSRGAFTARSFLGFIRHAGILDVVGANNIEKAIEIYRNAPAGQTGEESALAMRFRARYCRGVCVSEKDREFRARIDKSFDPEKSPVLDIRYLGVWDTVRALGIPSFLPFSGWVNAKYAYHDAILTSKIASARHAVAIDEERMTFEPTLFGSEKVRELNAIAQSRHGAQLEDWELPYHERWFPGVHSGVGGGVANRELSDVALSWVLRGARTAGLDVRDDDESVVFSIHANPLGSLKTGSSPTWADYPPASWLRAIFRRPRRGPTSLDELALGTLNRWYAEPSDLREQGFYRPKSLSRASLAISQWPFAPDREFKRRWSSSREYRVMKGDDIIRIAEKQLGDTARSKEIFAMNRDKLDDPGELPIGVVLRLPES